MSRLPSFAPVPLGWHARWNKEGLGGEMDRPRVVSPHAKRLKQAGYAGAGLALLLVTLGLSRLKPAAPSVDRSGVLIDTVKRGPLLRDVRGLGTLAPEGIPRTPAKPE